MTLKSYVIIGVIIATFLAPSVNSDIATIARDLTENERESGFYNENGYAISSQSARLPINPDFSPDESCLFDAYQLKCIPGSEQVCPADFGSNEDATCFPLIDNGEWGCPDGYHTRDDDESGQCYSNELGCEWPGYVFLKGGEDGEGDRCAVLYLICGTDKEERFEEECIEYCKEFSDGFGCEPD